MNCPDALSARDWMTPSGGHGVSCMQCSRRIRENSASREVVISCVTVSSISTTRRAVADCRSDRSNLI